MPAIPMSRYSLPLFPLNVVSFPGGLMPLRIFETRYLDMVRSCLRNKTQFGLVAAMSAPAQRKSEGLPFHRIGTRLEIIEADVIELGMMHIRCRAEQRFRVLGAQQQGDGLWLGEVEDLPEESALDIPADLESTGSFLKQLMESLVEQGVEESQLPFLKPYRFDDCAWVSGRWCEILAIPLGDKQRMLELDSPLVRLELVNDWIEAELAKGRRQE
ncbi:MAG: peptidase S16 [Methylobacterium sp.]|nr:peptidase S16 [Methylobacterium sp.]